MPGEAATVGLYTLVVCIEVGLGICECHLSSSEGDCTPVVDCNEGL
jgi:hypothetical protein